MPDRHERIEADCSWCGNNKVQGDGVVYCEACPWYVEYPEDLSEAPPHVINAFAEYKKQKWMREAYTTNNE